MTWQSLSAWQRFRPLGIGFHYSVYLERPVYSLYFASRRTGTREAAEAIVDKYQLDTLLFTPLVGAEMAMLPYFRERYGNAQGYGKAQYVQGSRKAQDVQGSGKTLGPGAAYLVRVRP